MVEVGWMLFCNLGFDQEGEWHFSRNIVEEVDNMVDLFCRLSVVGSLSCVIMYPLEKQKHLTLGKVSYFSTWVLVHL